MNERRQTSNCLGKHGTYWEVEGGERGSESTGKKHCSTQPSLRYFSAVRLCGRGFAAALAAVASTPHPKASSLQPLLTDQASAKVLKGRANEEPPRAEGLFSISDLGGTCKLPVPTPMTQNLQLGWEGNSLCLGQGLWAVDTYLMGRFRSLFRVTRL